MATRTKKDPQVNPPVDDEEEIEVAPFEAGEKLAPLDDAPEKEALPSEKEDVIDILTPKADHKLWTFESETFGMREWTQKPLGFMAKMEWFALVGDVIDKAMSGPNPLNIADLFSSPQGLPTDAQGFREANTFVQAVGKLVYHAPDFLTKSYAIWLGVKPYEREIFYEIAAEELGDDEGWEILNRFVDQNWEALQSFFGNKRAELMTRIDQRRKGLTPGTV